MPCSMIYSSLQLIDELSILCTSAYLWLAFGVEVRLIDSYHPYLLKRYLENHKREYILDPTCLVSSQRSSNVDR
jgi:hypothetical protein